MLKKNFVVIEIRCLEVALEDLPCVICINGRVLYSIVSGDECVQIEQWVETFGSQYGSDRSLVFGFGVGFITHLR